MANIKQLLSPYQYKRKTVIPRKGQTEYLLHIWSRTITKVKRNTGTCFFAIWFISLLSYHNRYLLRYENLLRQVDCRVTLAYWDWSLFSMSPWNNTSDRIWYPGPSGLGGNGSDGSSGGCVTDGPFSRNVWRKTNGRCLRRRFSGEKQLIPTFSTLFFFSFHLQLQILPTDPFFPLLEFGALKKDSWIEWDPFLACPACCQNIVSNPGLMTVR